MFGIDRWTKHLAIPILRSRVRVKRIAREEDTWVERRQLDARACGSQADVASLIDLLAVAVNERTGAAGTLGRVLEQAQIAPVRHGPRDVEPISIGSAYADEGGYSDYDFRDLHDGDLRSRQHDAHRLAAGGPEPVRECNYSFDVDNILSTYRAIRSISRLTLVPSRRCLSAVTSTVCGIRLIENSQPSSRSFTELTVRLTPLTVIDPLYAR